MKTLSNTIIVYDNECPMCDLYTGAFLKTAMLEKNGRVGFTEATELMEKHNVDRNRACDEIALIDTQTGTIRYGVDSLMRILENRFPFLQRIFSSKVFVFIIRKLYAFISFNRKVIIPGRDTESRNACRPTFNLNYRIAYLIFTWLITSFILANYAKLLRPLIPETNFYREFLICGGQILFQGIIIIMIEQKKPLNTSET